MFGFLADVVDVVISSSEVVVDVVMSGEVIETIEKVIENTEDN